MAAASTPGVSGAAIHVTAGIYDLGQACGAWFAQDETGEFGAVCVVELAGVTTDGSFDDTVVAWWHECGSAVGCSPYSFEAAIDPADFTVDPGGTSASLNTVVEGCALTLTLQGSPQPDDRTTGPYVEIDQLPESARAGIADWQFRDAAGLGSLCNDALAEGPTSSGGIWRASGIDVKITNTTTTAFEILHRSVERFPVQ